MCFHLHSDLKHYVMNQMALFVIFMIDTSHVCVREKENFLTHTVTQPSNNLNITNL